MILLGKSAKFLNSASARLKRLAKISKYRFIRSNLNLQWKLRSGILLQVENQAEWVIYNDIFVDREYDWPIEIMLGMPDLNQPIRILDVGANVGFFSLKVVDSILNKAHKLDFEVTLIEGSPRNYERLSSRLSMLEPAVINRIKPVFGLVGFRSGSARILETEFHVMNSVLNDSVSNIFRGTEVKFLDLYELYGEDDVIDLLKCDIEGSEQIFIENYRTLLGRVRHAVFEFHHSEIDTEKCIKLLEEAGLVHHKILRVEARFSVIFFSKSSFYHNCIS